MPALVRAVGLDLRRAAGTNLVVGFLLGVAGSPPTRSRRASSGTSSPPDSPGRFRARWLGAHVTGFVAENVLRVAVGVTLVLVGGVFAAQAIFA